LRGIRPGKGNGKRGAGQLLGGAERKEKKTDWALLTGARNLKGGGEKEDVRLLLQPWGGLGEGGAKEEVKKKKKPNESRGEGQNRDA